MMNKWATTKAALLLTTVVNVVTARNIIVGQFEGQPIANVFWSDGVCFAPVNEVKAGDTLEFRYSGRHNVFMLKDEDGFDECNFSDDATELATQNQSPYKYTVTVEDVSTKASLYFACGVGGHCNGRQKLRVNLVAAEDDTSETIESKFALGVSEDRCDAAYTGDVDLFDGSEDDRSVSECTEPVSYIDSVDGLKYYSSSCLSRPFTMTPGGIINQQSILYFPFPRDRRVIIGTRLWEFVQGEDLDPVYVNQLYVHHILGRVIKGNGAESIRRHDEDARFPSPYGKLSGGFDNAMAFHLIDLREVPENATLECLECRCADNQESGGVKCCTNCTSLVTPTVDYRMRYNVTWSEISDFVKDQGDGMVRPITTLFTDVAHTIDEYIEFDVPHYSELPEEQRHPSNPHWQILVREGTIRTLFAHSFPPNRPDYEGSDILEIYRCTAHMHIGGISIGLEDVETGEPICISEATYGTDPNTNLGFLTSLSVTNFDAQNPKVISADQPLRLVSIYNATVAHGGVMGLFDLEVADSWHGNVGKQEAALTVDLCQTETCNASQVPNWCVDNLEETFLCQYRGICDCKDDFLTSASLPGCGEVLDMGRNGVYKVDTLCARSCGCPAGPEDQDVVVENLQKQIYQTKRHLCRYNTKECQSFLSNLYTCSQENKPGVDKLDDVVRSSMREHGTIMVSQYAKLGDPFMHKHIDGDAKEAENRNLQQKVPICALEVGANMDNVFDENVKESESTEKESGVESEDFNEEVENSESPEEESVVVSDSSVGEPSAGNLIAHSFFCGVLVLAVGIF